MRGVITILWSAPVSTFVDTCPQIDVSYLYDPVFNATGLIDAKSGADFDVGVSVGPTSSYAVPDPTPKSPATVVLPSGAPSIVPGTSVLSGTITVHDVPESGAGGSLTRDLTFNFSDATGTLVFTPQQDDWLQIEPGSTLARLQFVNAYAVGALAAGSNPVYPGRVTVSGQQQWFEYQYAGSSNVTVWPGFDVSSAISAE